MSVQAYKQTFSRIDHAGLHIGRLYRLVGQTQKPELNRKVVEFLGILDRPFDIRRAVVKIVESDGSLGEEWLVQPQSLASIR